MDEQDDGVEAIRLGFRNFLDMTCGYQAVSLWTIITTEGSRRSKGDFDATPQIRTRLSLYREAILLDSKDYISSRFPCFRQTG